MYLYLTKAEWAHVWLHGGPIPLSLASTYKNDTRAGTQTPDENRIHNSPVDLTTYHPAIKFQQGQGITMTNMNFTGVQLPDLVNVDYFEEDGLIQSFCRVERADVAHRFGGKQACVQIADMNELFKIISRQLGTTGKKGWCSYTTDHQRNHFLKSTEDEWQQEYRFFWPAKAAAQVLLPPRVAKLVATYY